MDISNVQVYGIIILIAGLALRYFINRRKFNRRNVAGVQTFNSYEHKVVVQPIERFFKLVAMILILFGLFLIAIEWYNHKSAGNLPGKEPAQAGQQ